MRYGDALAIQQDLVEQRKRGLIPDQLLFVEHRTSSRRAATATPKICSQAKTRCAAPASSFIQPIAAVTSPIMVQARLSVIRSWICENGSAMWSLIVRAVEQVIIDALAEFGIAGGRVPGCTGVWVDGKKVAAIGVHISRWVTSHGFALNHTTDLRYFQYIVPCGLTKPVTSMQELGSGSSREQVIAALSTQLCESISAEPRTTEPRP